MKFKITSISLFAHGILNLVIHFPALILTSFFGLLIIGVFDLFSPITRPEFVNVIIVLPIFIPLISCIAGIIRGAIYLKRDKFAIVCLLFSILGLFIYIGMIALCYWLGSVA